MQPRCEVIGDCQLWLGDARDIAPTRHGVDACITDPPYGMAWHFTGQGSGKQAGGSRTSQFKGSTIAGDARAFDPTFLLGYPKVVIWGFQHYPHKLGRGSILVWIKKYESGYGTFLSDADLAWMKGGCGVYLSRVLPPASFQHERQHPTQKPTALMAWCIQRCQPVECILDPFMGSCSTGVACIGLGKRFIGIDIDEHWHTVACRRIEAAYRQPDLFLEHAKRPAPIQQPLFPAGG